MAMKNGGFLYNLCIKNLQIYDQRARQKVLAAAYFFAILPNCQYPKPNCGQTSFWTDEAPGQLSLQDDQG